MFLVSNGLDGGVVMVLVNLPVYCLLNLLMSVGLNGL